MEVVSTASAENLIESSKSMESSPSRRTSNADTGISDSPSSSSPAVSSIPGPPDQPSSPLDLQKDLEIQSWAELKSEEYRQLFRLPPEEVLIQDFNCACQESILLQGHMYVFIRYICFYSNIFGFETKKIIPFSDITCIRRAKTAGIFPNAIEIIAGVRKYFFASFLSRDEAFKLINDGWLQHSNESKSVTEHQESILETYSQDNGLVVIDKVETSTCPPIESDSINGIEVAAVLNGQDEPVSTGLQEVQDIVEVVEEEEQQPVIITGSLSSENSFTWKEENYEAPKIPEYYTKVAEAKFPVKVEQFFSFFFSDAASDFLESFHQRCGDKDLKSSPWHPHEKFGHARNVSFQHPIKIYFGAKFGGCNEIQKFRVFKNSHLIIETSQEISDVPYGDYFAVEGLWDLKEDESKENCVLQVYVNVAFSKRTVWKGKIVQSTVEECREAYATWIESAHELLKQKNLEKEKSPVVSTIGTNQVQEESIPEILEPSESSRESIDPMRVSTNVEHQVENHLQGNITYNTPPIVSFFKELMEKFSVFLRSRSHLPVLLITFAAILILMQISIMVLLTRPAQVHMISQTDYMNGMGSALGQKSSETLGWVEKRMHYLKEEMLMVESRLEQMNLEHRYLKSQFEDLERYKKKLT